MFLKFEKKNEFHQPSATTRNAACTVLVVRDIDASGPLQTMPPQAPGMVLEQWLKIVFVDCNVPLITKYLLGPEKEMVLLAVEREAPRVTIILPS